MQKNKFILLLLALTCVGPQARAGLKVDVAATAGKVVSVVEETAEKASTVVNTVAGKVQEFYTGANTAFESVKALKEDVAAAASSVQDTYENTQKKIDEVTGTVEGLKDKAVKTYEEQVEGLTGSDAGQVSQITKQLTDKEKEIEDYKKNAETQLLANQQSAATNLKILQQMYDEATDEDVRNVIGTQITFAELDLQNYVNQAEQFEKDEDSFLQDDEEYQKLVEEKKLLEKQLAEFGIDTGKKFFQTSLASMLKKSPEEKTTEYNAMIKENFLLPDEPENEPNVKRIRTHREEVLTADVKNAFITAAQLKLNFDDDLERLQRKKDNIAAVDAKLTAGNLLIEQRIEDIKILYNYTNLIIADMRLKTSLNIRNQKYRLLNYDKDPAKLNLDNYVFTVKDVPTDEDKTGILAGVTD